MFTPNREEICKRRKQLGLNRSALSRNAGLPENSISRIENGRVERIQPLRAKEIARALGCEVGDIFL